ncbi:hypothetical protein Tco_1033052 [Tanacetum coccineum]|uniref:Retrotransposon gag domain-containing protein n=1 Tax=Tanacetum coccineum TaxID=301880 RepID=A0ABQ5GEX2_9ASTR
MFHINSSTSSHQHNQSVDNGQKDYKVRYKALKAELALLTQKIKDEGVTTVKAFMAIVDDEPAMGKTNARSGHWVEITMKKQIPANIVRALGGRGKRKDSTSFKEVLFTKAEDSPIENLPECASDDESVNNNQEPLLALPKLSGAEPIGASKGDTSAIDLTQTSTISEKTKQVIEKYSQLKVIKKKAQPKTPTVPEPSHEKRLDSSTEQLLLTLMKEVKGLKEQIKPPSDNLSSISQTRSSKSEKNKQKAKFGPCNTVCITRSSTKKLFTPFEDPEQEFCSSRKLFKRLSLDESSSPEFDLFSDLEEHSEEEIAETMTKTMKNTCARSEELRDNTFSGSDHEDANEHIEKFLEIVDLFHIPGITQDQIMLRAFPISLTGAASRWLMNEPSGTILNWETLKKKFLSKYCPPARTAKKIEEINNFQQEPDETLYRAWERFKEL